MAVYLMHLFEFVFIRTILVPGTFCMLLFVVFKFLPIKLR
jgi:hypothetical protein